MKIHLAVLKMTQTFQLKLFPQMLNRQQVLIVFKRKKMLSQEKNYKNLETRVSQLMKQKVNSKELHLDDHSVNTLFWCQWFSWLSVLVGTLYLWRLCQADCMVCYCWRLARLIFVPILGDPGEELFSGEDIFENIKLSWLAAPGSPRWLHVCFQISDRTNGSLQNTPCARKFQLFFLWERVSIFSGTVHYILLITNM